ncbi:MAG TPA: DUF6580 family putative transport protein [Opitutus sp.]|nr:DUF6580 family putative transport protein [Opitutus sp.]
MILAAVLILVAAGWRIAAAWEPSLANFAPLMALAFCGGVYFRNPRLWLIPLAALTLSDLYLDHYYATQFGYIWTWGAAGIRALCFVLAIFFGWMVSHRKSWLNLFSGTLAGAVIFYLVTNSHAWWYDLAYAKTAAGWWQAMTVGHPQFPPTLFFFRNSLVSDLFFTGIFALVMEYRALRHAQPSLLARAQA